MTKQLFLVVPVAMWLAACSDAPKAKPVDSSAQARCRIRHHGSHRDVAFDLRSDRHGARPHFRCHLRETDGLCTRSEGADGDHVREGQLLVTLDPRDLDVSSRRAESAREEVRAGIPEADSAVAAAKANLDLAQVTFGRMQDMYQKKSISNQEFDEASARLKAAQAAHDMARARRTQLDSRLAQADQEVRSTEVTRSYAEVLAPFAGVVVARSVEPGILAIPGTPMFTIEREGAYRLEASVEESRLSAIRVGQPVSVTLDGLDHTLEARVSEIVPAVDAASRAYIVKIDLPALATLRSGVFGRAGFQLGSQSVMAIPAAAVAEHGQLQSVFVDDNGIARVAPDHHRAERSKTGLKCSLA